MRFLTRLRKESIVRGLWTQGFSWENKISGRDPQGA
jgi:hypothetical protein